MEKKKPSHKHHYLPRYYLKGFTDSSGGFFVYDKQTGKIFPTSPDAAFFENDLNTVEKPDGTRSDFLEDVYTNIENQSWNSLDTIRNSTSHGPIELLDRLHLSLFLLFLHWRLPSNLLMAEKLTTQLFHEGNALDFAEIQTTNGDAVPKEVLKEIINLPSIKKSAKVIPPFAPFFKDKNWSNKLMDWRFLYTEDMKSWYIVGDNPIITRGINDHDPLNCLNEFIFPVSGKILLISKSGPIKKSLPPEFTVQYSAGIIERAKRFVACQNKDLLETLVDYHKMYVNNSETNKIIPKLFEMLE